ncbi:MAG: TonB-dependent receptor [Vicinamibacteria bacterium]|nr:TonB-dependent receptor [Vicinamibacteria bacterium]
MALLRFLALYLAIAAHADAGVLTGRVLDPAGRPVPGATVLVDGPLGVRTTTTDAEGHFTFGDLADASYRVLVESVGFASPALTIRTGADTAPIDLHLHVAPYSEAVVVAAALVPRPRSESPASTTVVASEDIKARQLETVADALRTTPGFAVGRNGGRGALTSVFPRGGESDYTLVLVDGIRVNSFGGGFDFSLLPLGDVDQVEIVRGPQSAVFGADAIGGVVHLRTRQGGKPTVSGQIEGGGQATVRALAATRGSVGAWSFSVSGERNHSDGFTGIAPATGETVSNDDWAQSLAQGHLEWTKSATTAVRADLRWLDAERGNSGPFGSDPIGAYTAVDRVSRGEDTQRQIGLNGRLPWGSVLAGRIQQRWQVTVAELDNRYHSSFGDSFFQTRRVSARTQTDVVVTPTTGLTAGVEGFGERARSTYITGESFQAVPIERRTFGGFAEVRQDLGARASVSVGLRADAIRRNSIEGDPNPFGPRPAFADESVTSVNPRLAGRVVAWQDQGGVARTTVRASVGTGIRPPDAFEIAFTDNPALEPERSRSADIGVSHVLLPQVTVEATAFFNRYDDLIVAVGRAFADASRYRTDNISNARARGVELEGAWRGPRGVHARLAYTWMPTEILAVDQSGVAPPPFAVGDPLIRRPRHQGAVDLGWTAAAFSAFTTVRVRGEVLDVEPSYGAFGGLFTAAGFTVVDAGASWRLARHVEVFGRGLNLLDRQYEEAYGYPAPGRLGMVGLRVDLRP